MHNLPISTEYAVLIQLTAPPSAFDAGRVSALLNSPTMNWDRLTELCTIHSLLPLAYERLTSILPPHLPPNVPNRLHELAQQHAARGAFLTARLKTTSELLMQHSIPFMAFKGPTLAQVVYGSHTLRRYDDLDFLVSPPDMKRAKYLMLSEGYQLHVNLDAQAEDAYLRAGWEYIFIHPQEAYSIEFDSSIAPRYFSFDIPFQSLWERRMAVSTHEITIDTPSIEDHLILLCAHGTKHMWRRLIWITDIAWILQASSTMDWDYSLRTMKDSGAVDMVRVGVQLACQLYDLEMPPALNRTGRTQVIERLRREALDIVTDPDANKPGVLQEMRYHTRSRERLSDRMKYFVRLTLTPSFGDWSLVIFPKPLRPIYFIIRPFRIIARMLLRRIPVGNRR